MAPKKSQCAFDLMYIKKLKKSVEGNLDFEGVFREVLVMLVENPAVVLGKG